MQLKKGLFFIPFLLIFGKAKLDDDFKLLKNWSDYLLLFCDDYCVRIYRPSFHENKPKTLVFT